jgi:hypothetical protein
VKGRKYTNRGNQLRSDMPKEDRKARQKLKKNVAKYGWRCLDREILRASRKRLKKKKKKGRRKNNKRKKMTTMMIVGVIIIIMIIPHITDVQ